MDDLYTLFEYAIISEDHSDLFSTVDIDTEKERISNILDQVKDIKYGFLDKNTGERYDDREWIHNCPNIGKYYKVQEDPEVTLNSKLGICIDQCIALKYLFNKYFPEDETEMWALMKSPKGHCTFSYNHDGNWYYLENAWDKMKDNDQPTLYGPFKSKDDVKQYFVDLYTEKHKDDTPADSQTYVCTYDDYLNGNVLNESLKVELPALI